MSVPVRVWLTRHAETAVPTVFHGFESDIGLSELGSRQAIAAAEWFREQGPTLVVSSGMKRAIDTATPIAATCSVRHHIEPGLHERKVGALGGTSFTAAQGPWAETIREWTSGNTAYTTPGAESFDEVQSRVVAAWDRVIAAHPGERIAIVAHGVVCKVLLLTLLEGWEPRGWSNLGRVANLSVTELYPAGAKWTTPQRLVVPPQVAALSDGLPTGVGGPTIVRSEA